MQKHWLFAVEFLWKQSGEFHPEIADIASLFSPEDPVQRASAPARTEGFRQSADKRDSPDRHRAAVCGVSLPLQRKRGFIHPQIIAHLHRRALDTVIQSIADAGHREYIDPDAVMGTDVLVALDHKRSVVFSDMRVSKRIEGVCLIGLNEIIRPQPVLRNLQKPKIIVIGNLDVHIVIPGDEPFMAHGT